MDVNQLVLAIRQVATREFPYPSEVEMLGAAVQEKDKNEDWLLANDYYRWHWAAARVLMPAVVAEIGVRFGYSAKAMCQGCTHVSVTVSELILIDAELYEPGSMVVAVENLIKDERVHRARPFFKDTQKLASLRPLDIGEVKLFHVDGDHSFDGALHDMGLAWEVLSPGGVMLVDDYTFLRDVRRACEAFTAQTGAPHGVLESYRGTAVFLKAA